MADIELEPYFNKEYLGSTLWFGIGIINALGGLGSYMYIPSWLNFGYIRDSPWNRMTEIAWYWLIGGNMIWYYFIGAVWLFSYIRKPFPQKSLFWSIIVGQGLAWVNTLWVNIAFLVGGVTKGATW